MQVVNEKHRIGPRKRSLILYLTGPVKGLYATQCGCEKISAVTKVVRMWSTGFTVGKAENKFVV